MAHRGPSSGKQSILEQMKMLKWRKMQTELKIREKLSEAQVEQERDIVVALTRDRAHERTRWVQSVVEDELGILQHRGPGDSSLALSTMRHSGQNSKPSNRSASWREPSLEDTRGSPVLDAPEPLWTPAGVGGGSQFLNTPGSMKGKTSLKKKKLKKKRENVAVGDSRRPRQPI